MAPYIQSFETEKEKGFRNRSYLFAQIIYMFWALLLSSIGGVDENIWNFIVLTLFNSFTFTFISFVPGKPKLMNFQEKFDCRHCTYQIVYTFRFYYDFCWPGSSVTRWTMFANTMLTTLRPLMYRNVHRSINLSPNSISAVFQSIILRVMGVILLFSKESK